MMDIVSVKHGLSLSLSLSHTHTMRRQQTIPATTNDNDDNDNNNDDDYDHNDNNDNDDFAAAETMVASNISTTTTKTTKRTSPPPPPRPPEATSENKEEEKAVVIAPKGDLVVTDDARADVCVLQEDWVVGLREIKIIWKDLPQYSSIETIPTKDLMEPLLVRRGEGRGGGGGGGGQRRKNRRRLSTSNISPKTSAATETTTVQKITRGSGRSSNINRSNYIRNEKDDKNNIHSTRTSKTKAKIKSRNKNSISTSLDILQAIPAVRTAATLSSSKTKTNTTKNRDDDDDDDGDELLEEETDEEKEEDNDEVITSNETKMKRKIRQQKYHTKQLSKKKMKNVRRDSEYQDGNDNTKNYDDEYMGLRDEEGLKDEDDSGDSDDGDSNDDHDRDNGGVDFPSLKPGCPRMRPNVSPQEQRYELKLSPMTTSNRTSLNIWSTLIGGGGNEERKQQPQQIGHNDTSKSTNRRVIKSLSEPPYMPMLSSEDNKDDLRYDYDYGYDDDEGSGFEEYYSIMNDGLIPSPTTKRRRKTDGGSLRNFRSDGCEREDGEVDRDDKTGLLLLTKTNIHTMLLLQNKLQTSLSKRVH